MVRSASATTSIPENAVVHLLPDNELVIEDGATVGPGGIDVVREDGWITLFRRPDAILRVHEEHVQSLERSDGSDLTHVGHGEAC
jgi:hypothetical protein